MINLNETYDQLSKLYEGIKTDIEKQELQDQVNKLTAIKDGVEAKVEEATQQLAEVESQYNDLKLKLETEVEIKNNLIKPIYQDLLGNSIYYKEIIRKRPVETEIVLTEETLVIQEFNKGEQDLYVIVNSADGKRYLPIAKQDNFVIQEPVRSIIRDLVAQSIVVDDLKRQINSYSSSDQSGILIQAKNKLNNANTELVGARAALGIKQRELDKIFAKEKARFARKAKNRDNKILTLDDTSEQVQKSLEKTQGVNLWIAIGWLAKHTINLRVRGPEEYYKDKYESRFGPGYEVNGNSAEHDWPGGTLICDTPFSANNSAFVFVSEAIEDSNKIKASEILHDTKNITIDDSATNCLALVYMLLDKYNFRMGPGEQPVDEIAPLGEVELEMFDMGYNS